MAWKWSDGTRAACLRALAAWAVYALLASPNKPALLVAVEVAEVLLAAIFLAALAQTLFCRPEHVRARHGGDHGGDSDEGDDAAVVLPLVDGQAVPRVVDGGDELHKAQPAQCAASAPVEGDAAEDGARALPVPGSHERSGDGGAAECAVCLGEVEEGERVKRLPLCLHVFHQTCIDVWLRGHSACPACRCEVFAPSAADEMV